MVETELDDRMNYEVPVEDPVGNRAYIAEWRHHRTLQILSAALLVCLIASVGAIIWQSRRPPVVLVERLDDMGRAEIIHSDAMHFTPREGEVRARLNDWALHRYRLSKVLGTNWFGVNYDYMVAPLAHRLMPQDEQQLAKILAGQAAEQDVTVHSIRFDSISNTPQRDGAVSTGQAVILLTKVTGDSSDQQKQNIAVTVRYEVNLRTAAIRSESDPQFELANPLGVLITWFHEDQDFH